MRTPSARPLWHRTSSFSIAGAAIAAALLAAACGGGSEPASGTAPASTGRPADTADGPGVIAGTVTFDGAAPPPRPLRMDSDPKCTPGPGAVSEQLVVGPGGGLQNVFVYVKDGLGQRTYAVSSTPVLLDQKGCQYVPHVFGVQAGQTFQVANSDTALHNVHAVPKTNQDFNFSQPVNVPPVDRVFAKPEIGIPLKCDVHGWMSAYVNVVTHPFFGVTAADGAFTIKGLPPGSYTIEAWHETLGTRTQAVDVDGKTPAAVKLSFKPAA